MKIFKKILFMSSLMTTVAVSCYSGDISVTEVSVRGNMARILINDVIRISEIKIKGEELEFPAYVKKSGKKIPQVVIKTPSSMNIIKNAIQSRKPSTEIIKKINYKISKMSTFGKAGSSLKAFAAVTFNGEIEIECKIMKSKSEEDDYYITWPARPPDREAGEFKWFNQVQIINRKVKTIIEQDLLETYKKTPPDGQSQSDKNLTVIEAAGRGPMSVTKITVQKASDPTGLEAIAHVELNYAFKLNNVKLYNRRGNKFLELPGNEYKGRRYEEARIFSKALRDEIKKSIQTGKISEVVHDKITFEITRFDPHQYESSVKYKCAVTLNSAIEIECKIIDTGKFRPFIAWPSKKENDKYIDIIFPSNKGAKEIIEQKLIDRYRQATKK